MSEVIFNCKDCGHSFKGSELTTECERCNSINIMRPNKGLSINKKRALIIGGILLIIIGIIIIENLFRIPPAETLYEAEIELIDQRYFFKIYKTENGRKSELKMYKVKVVRNKRTKKEIEFNEEGELFLCPQDTGLVNIEFILDERKAKVEAISKDFSLFGNEPSQYAKCPVKPTGTDFDIQVSNNPCQVNLKVINSQINRGDLEISIDGPNGNFENKFNWSRDDFGVRYDVWIIYKESDTIELFKNNDLIPKCAEIDLVQLKSRGDRCGQNPTDRTAMNSFRTLALSLPKLPKVFLDGKELADFSELVIIMQTEFSDEGTKFKMVRNPIIIDNGQRVQIEMKRL